MGLQNWLERYNRPDLRPITIQSRPISDHKIGATRSPGIERPINYFVQEHYTENLIQALVNANAGRFKSCIIGGNSHPVCQNVVQKIISVLLANKVSVIYLGLGGNITRPGISIYCKSRKISGILCHNSCLGISSEVDFGIAVYNKYGEGLSDRSVYNFFRECSKITEYCISEGFNENYKKDQCTVFQIGNDNALLNIVDVNREHMAVLRKSFDFKKISDLFCGRHMYREFRIRIDCLNGCIGPCLKYLIEEELGAAKGSVLNSESNSYVRSLDASKVEQLEIRKIMTNGIPDMGATIDSDGGRCVVFGKHGFIVPSGDTIAVFADNHYVIPCFQWNDFTGAARNFYSSSALDVVLADKQLPIYITPDAWRFFVELIKNKHVIMCGDGDYGVGSSHTPERDGLFTILAWLTVICHRQKPIKEILLDHWSRYGRNYTSQHDFCCVPFAKARSFVQNLHTKLNNGVEGTPLEAPPFTYIISKGDVCTYMSPCTSKIYKKMGILLELETPKKAKAYIRVIKAGLFCKVRILIDLADPDVPLTSNPLSITASLTEAVIKWSNIRETIGREMPDISF